MEKFIPFEKRSKKEQKAQNAARRGSWYGINPVTRKPENPKAYNRRKAQKWSEDSGSVPFAVLEVKFARGKLKAVRSAPGETSYKKLSVHGSFIISEKIHREFICCSY